MCGPKERSCPHGGVERLCLGGWAYQWSWPAAFGMAKVPGLVMGERLDLLPRERGGGVGDSGVSAKSSARAGPRAAALVDCGVWLTVMATSVRRVLSDVVLAS